MYTKDQLEQLSDLELMCYLCGETDDGEAYKLFVNRFYDDVKKECERHCRSRKLDRHLGTQIAHDTFDKMRRHKTFRADNIRVTDSRKGILAYLIRISINLFNDHHRKQKKETAPVGRRSYFENLVSPAELQRDPQRLKELKDATSQIFKTLNKKEQAVIIADLENKNHLKYLPDEVTLDLASTLGIKPATIRKIRERANAKIKSAIDEFNS